MSPARRGVAVVLLVLMTTACADVGRWFTDEQDAVVDPVAVLPTDGTEAPARLVPTRPPFLATPDAPEPTPTATPTSDATPVAASEGEASDVALRLSQLCVVVAEDFCTDTDGDVMPDVLEAELAMDPAVPQCPLDDCDAAPLTLATLSQAESNTVVLVDGSAEMSGVFGGEDGPAVVGDAITRFAVATPDYAEAGLSHFGHLGDPTAAGRLESCSSFSTPASLGELTHATADASVQDLTAGGWRPLEGALTAIGPILQSGTSGDAQLGNTAPASRVVLVAAGGETCGGDPVATARTLADEGVRIDVVGIGPNGGSEQLRAIAEVTGGTYTAAPDPGALTAALDARAVEPLDVLAGPLCQARAVTARETCLVATDQAVATALALRADEAEADGALEEAARWLDYATLLRTQLAEWAEARRAESGGIAAVDGAELLPAEVEALAVQADQAVERFRAAYGEEIALLDCPLEDRGALASGTLLV